MSSEKANELELADELNAIAKEGTGALGVFRGWSMSLLPKSPGQAGCQRRRPSPRSSRVGFRIALFEVFSAFTHVTACMLAKSPKATLYTGVLQPLRYLHDRSDCYRLEQQVAGRELHPLKIHAFARHTATLR